MEKRPVCVVSVDIGTSSVRACLFSIDLSNIHHRQLPILLETDVTGRAEQDFEKIHSAVCQCISDVIEWADANQYSTEAICFSNAVSSLVCLDSNFNPVRPVLTYADLRARDQAETLKKDFSIDVFRETACPVHASYWLPKFKWLKNEGFNYSKSNYFCTIKDLIVFKLTGQFITDFSNAVATGMCNTVSGEWDEQLLALAEISSNQLPRIMPTTAIILHEKNDSTDSLHIPDNMKIVLGATDGVLSSLGAGAYKPGQVTTMIGSSGACRIAAESPLIHQSNTVTWSYPLDENVWIRGGAMNSGGLVTQWLVENFFHGKPSSDEEAFEEMLNLASSINPCSDGLLFLPYIFGERAPIWDENARGVFFGIHGSHQLGNFARAAIEGILFALYSIYEIITSDYDGDITVRATGGYLRSELMVQIQTDIFNIPVGVPSNYEGSSIGAAILALKALRLINSYDEISEFIKVKKVYKPNEKRAQIYKEQFRKFKEIYRQLKPLY